MAELKQLTPDEYSEDRKEAEKEMEIKNQQKEPEEQKIANGKEKKKSAGYVLSCCKCNAMKKTNYQTYKKKEKAGLLNKHICRKCKKQEKK